jgi:hypothetical protein
VNTKSKKASMDGMAAVDCSEPASSLIPESILYNVPAGLRLDDGRKVILRTSDPAKLPNALANYAPEDVAWVELTTVPATADELDSWPEGIPIDIILPEPASTFPTLYRCAALVGRHPVRVSMPAEAGFGKAAKLSVSLQFAVKLDVGQPERPMVDELLDVLDLYLHKSTVAQPIEFFHSILFAFLQNEPVSLWQIAEEDPRAFRFITDSGVETMCGRLAGVPLGDDPGGFVERFKSSQLRVGSECGDCRFFDLCGGYFKWPDRSFRCDGVKEMFQTLQESAVQLAGDVANAAVDTDSERPA